MGGDLSPCLIKGFPNGRHSIRPERCTSMSARALMTNPLALESAPLKPLFMPQVIVLLSRIEPSLIVL